MDTDNGVPLRRPRALAGAAGGPLRTIWLISFTDLVCLMLTFFVLKFSMAEPIHQRWQAMTASLAAAHLAGAPGADFNIAALAPETATNLDYLTTLLAGQFAADADLAGIVPVRADDRVIIGLPDRLLFDPAQAVFSDRGRRALFILGGVLGRIGNRIEITGHAEREPPVPGSGRTGWELALTRTVAVALALRESGYRQGLVARAVAAFDIAERAAGPGADQGNGRARLIEIVVRDRKEPAP